MTREQVKAVAQWLDRLYSGSRSVPRSAWLVGALLVGAALRLPGLGQQSLWVDEGHTYIWMTLPLDELLASLLAGRDEVPLYYVLMWFWSKAFGTSEFALRLPSAWLAVANIAAVYRLGRLSGCERVGIWGAFALAANPFLVWYSRDARAYSALLLLVTAMMWSFIRVLHRVGRGRWLALILLSGTAYLTHYITLALGVVQLAVFLITFRKSYCAFRRWVIAQALAVIPVAGWFALATLHHGFSSIRGTWHPMPTWGAPLASLWNFSIGYDAHLAPRTALALIPFAIALVSVRRLHARLFWIKTLLVWLVLPIGTALILSAGVGPAYTDRYLSVCVPGYLLLIASGLSALPGPRVRAALGVWLLGAMIVSSLGILSGERFAKPSWRVATARIVNESKEGDRLLVDAKGLFVTFYYTGYAVPIERVEPDDFEASLSEGLETEGRIWFLYRDPLESVHGLDRVRRFDPYTSGDANIAVWLERHRSRIEQEWLLSGVYLALVD